MKPITFRDIKREYYHKGVSLMDLSIFMSHHNITYHTGVKPRLHGRPEELQNVRVLSKEMFSGLVVDVGANSVHMKSVNPGVIALHALDDKCIVIPNLKEYVGVYRFIPSDDAPTITGRRMGYFRCPNMLTAVSLSLWLRHPRVVEAVRHEFKKKRGKNSKEMNFDFLSVIPVPEGMLQPHIVGRALEIDNQMIASHKVLNELADELMEMSAEYACGTLI